MSTSLLHCLVAKMASVTLKDPSSLSNIQDFKCKHLSWNIEVDFPSKVLRCSAAFIVECLKENADKLVSNNEIIMGLNSKYTRLGGRPGLIDKFIR